MVVGGTDVSEVSDGQGLAGEVGWDGDGNVDQSVCRGIYLSSCRTIELNH